MRITLPRVSQNVQYTIENLSGLRQYRVTASCVAEDEMFQQNFTINYEALEHAAEKYLDAAMQGALRDLARVVGEFVVFGKKS